MLRPAGEEDLFYPKAVAFEFAERGGSERRALRELAELREQIRTMPIAIRLDLLRSFKCLEGLAAARVGRGDHLL